MALLMILAATAGAAQEAVSVSFVVLDAFVKDRSVSGVAVTVRSAADDPPLFEGMTDDQGLCEASLPPGVYRVSYVARGYVPVTSPETEVRSEGQVITTALSMLLEAEGSAAARRIRIILTWGSDADQVRDADSHLAFSEDGAHVYFGAKEHERDGYAFNLDVDDTDWGGPETITLMDPPAGSYTYWIYNYSGPPAELGQSDVVVRVLFDDEVVGEYRQASESSDREWRPFKELVVDGDLRPRVIPFTEQELMAGAVSQVPTELQEEGSSGNSAAAFVGLSILATVVGFFLTILIIAGRAIGRLLNR